MKELRGSAPFNKTILTSVDYKNISSYMLCFFFLLSRTHGGYIGMLHDYGDEVCHFTATNEDARRGGSSCVPAAEGRRGSSMNHLGGVSRDLSAAAKRQPREEVTRIRYAAGRGAPPPPLSLLLPRNALAASRSSAAQMLLFLLTSKTNCQQKADKQRYPSSGGGRVI